MKGCFYLKFVSPVLEIGSASFILYPNIRSLKAVTYLSIVLCFSQLWLLFCRKMKILAKVIRVVHLILEKIMWQSRPITLLFLVMHRGLIITGEWAVFICEYDTLVWENFLEIMLCLSAQVCLVINRCQMDEGRWKVILF